jgi:UDP-3-O-[3-hydroxymyristoyl] glucosamine N-acyltransferase
MMHFLKNVLKKYYFYYKYGARVSARASIPINTIIGKDVVIGKGTSFTDKVEIGNETEIAGDVSISGIVKIGNKCRIGRDVTIDSKKFYLGDYSLIYAHNYFDNKRLARIVIGRFCQIASGCEFRNVEHDITNLKHLSVKF